jgi:hypothetical protein
VTNGSITQTSGTLAAGTLTGSASESAQFGPDVPGAVASVGTLGAFSTPNGSFSLGDSVPLTVAGPLTAAEFKIVAPGQITLVDGAITTTGLPVGSQAGLTPAAPGSFFLVQPVQGIGNFTQIGTTTIQSLPGTSATVRIDVPSNGAISFNKLMAPSANLILGIVAARATGAIDVGDLLVLGQTGSSDLAGTVQGQTGPAAATVARILPAINQNYRLNNCMIALSSCIPPRPSVPPSPPAPPAPPVIVDPRQTSPSTVLPWWPIELMASGYADPVPQALSPDRVRPQTLDLGLAFPPVEPGESNPQLVLPNVSGRDY